jgi:hypothetical protein
MPVERVDPVLHAVSPEGFVDVFFEDEGGELGGGIRHVGDADGGDRHEEDPATRAVGQVDGLAEADRRHRNEGHVDAIEQRGPVA